MCASYPAIVSQLSCNFREAYLLPCLTRFASPRLAFRPPLLASREVSAPSYSARSSCEPARHTLAPGMFVLPGRASCGQVPHEVLEGFLASSSVSSPKSRPSLSAAIFAWLYPAVQPLHEARIALPGLLLWGSGPVLVLQLMLLRLAATSLVVLLWLLPLLLQPEP